MNPFLHIEYFDTDASSYKHKLQLELKSTKSFRLAEGGAVLEVDHVDGTTRNIPFVNVKQYYEVASTPE